MLTEGFEPQLFNRITFDNIVVNLQVILEFQSSIIDTSVFRNFVIGRRYKRYAYKVINNTKLGGIGCMTGDSSNSKDFHILKEIPNKVLS